MSDAGAVCQGTAFVGCLPRPHAVRVSIATDASVVIGVGATAPIGGLSITDGDFTELADTGSCDAKSRTLLAGFRLPQTTP